MARNIEGLHQLKRTIEDYLEGCKERKHIFNDLPKVDIGSTFSSWDDYIRFLDGNKEAEAKERERLTKDLREKGIVKQDQALHLVQITGGFDKLIEKQGAPLIGGIRSKLIELYQLKYQDNIVRLIDDTLDVNLGTFFVHDINHIWSDLTYQFFTIVNPKHDSSISRMRNNRSEVKRFLEQYNADPGSMYGAFLEPYKMLHFIVTSELGEKPITEKFQPAKLARQTALILQNRFVQAEYSLVDKLTDSKTNEIAVDAEDFTFNGNSGVVFSIIYNLAKNAYKKLGAEANNSQKIFIQVYEAPLSSYVITVGDNGKPIDLDTMKEKIRNLILEKGIDNVPFPNHSSKARYQRWQDSEYQVGNLRLKDITDVAFMARMSGFDNPDSFSSGMGLYGTKYLLENVGGRTLYGENFKNGGPLFTCIIPKNLPSNPVERYVNHILTKAPELSLMRSA
jgi:hypothetical protein